ncbi:hypothetical protein EJ02DRAFT_195009 [Clathrospora elynae]|uniref:Uncharacterized protein n=1 Tax=Clathrospora elynae TaxID=706981 RepID=A0A6A5SX74_9PLEO|nr:hypothetical protein EJ02DRAFT_195009 [Clathrospora elynae]
MTVPTAPAAVLPLEALGVCCRTNRSMPHMPSLSLLHQVQISPSRSVIACVVVCWLAPPSVAVRISISLFPAPSLLSRVALLVIVVAEGKKRIGKAHNAVYYTCTRGCI